MIERIAVKGYRLFRDFETDLQPGINVLIGANATGKSTLVELLRIAQSCCLGPLPVGIEPKPIAGQVFHPKAGGTMRWQVTLSAGPPGARKGEQRYTYEVAVKGAVPPVISKEELCRLPTKGTVRRTRARGRAATPNGNRINVAIPLLSIFHSSGGHGLILEGKKRPEWRLEPNEPMLSRAVDPRLRDAAWVRNEILGWRFYTELRATRTAPLREPQGLGGEPGLRESGENLALALLSLFSNLDHQEKRDDLLSYLRSAVPEMTKFAPALDASGKYVLLQWREQDVESTLSASDLSDGILRLLLLGVICCNPVPPRLICIDEPEIGLHPKLLPLVGGLLQHASDRSQIIVLTHSPQLLYDVPLENIAVLRKRDGEAQIVWPRNHDLLYHLLTEEIAGERQVDYDRLCRAHTSGEMDELG